MFKKFIFALFIAFLISYALKAEEDLDDISLLVDISLESSKVFNSKIDTLKDLSLNLSFPDKFKIRENITILSSSKFKKRIRQFLVRGEKYIPVIKQIFKSQSLPDDLVFLPLIESRFNIKAKSPAGAAGLWQFMPQTARMYGLEINKWIDERYDLIKSTQAAAYYLKDLYSIFDDWTLALASYNAGEGTIIRRINKYGGINFWDIRNYLSPETRDYVPRFLATLAVVKSILKGKNTFKTDFDVVQVDKPVSLELVSILLKVPYEKLQELNPHLLKGKTPPLPGTYNIYVPKGLGSTLNAVLSDMKLEKFKALKEYKVQRGDSLIKIAKKFHTSVAYLKKINNLNRGYILANTYIKVPSYIEAYPLYTSSVVDLTEDIQYTPKGIIYKVKKGDTLGKIANRFKVSVRALKRWNHIKGFILPNQKIIIYKRVLNKNLARKAMEHRVNYIKRKVKKRKPKFRYIFYKVKKGDSLLKIAKKFNVSVKSLKKWNKLKSNIIHINDRLTIIKRVVSR